MNTKHKVVTINITIKVVVPEDVPTKAYAGQLANRITSTIQSATYFKDFSYTESIFNERGLAMPQGDMWKSHEVGDQINMPHTTDRRKTIVYQITRKDGSGLFGIILDIYDNEETKS